MECSENKLEQGIFAPIDQLVVRMVGLRPGSPGVGTIVHSDSHQHGRDNLYFKRNVYR